MPFPEMIPINKPVLGGEEIHAVMRVLRSEILTEKRGCGPFVTRFENAFSRFVGSKYAIAVNSGTAALHSALIAAEVKPGDEVIVPSFSFVATAEVVALVGAKPVFVDIDPVTFCMNPDILEEAITKKTKAIIPVHLYGLTVDMDPIVNKTHDHDIVVIEDSAQAHGAEYKGRKAGILGDMSCFSFYASKCMTTGEGGMVTTNNKEYAETVLLVKNHGEEEPYKSIIVGHNFRMPEIEAAIGLAQLEKLPSFLEARRRNARILSEELEGFEMIKLPFEPKGYRHSWYVYTVRLKGAHAGRRNRIVEKIRKRHIGATIFYPTPIHLMPYYRERYSCPRGALPKTETASRQVFSLPVHQALSEEEATFIAKTVKKVIS